MPIVQRSTWKRRALLLTVAGVLVAGGGAPVHGGELLPGSCRPHPVKVVNSGCPDALAERSLPPQYALPNIVPDVRDVQVYRPWLYDPVSQTVNQGPPTLFFDTRAQNLGTVPLQLRIEGIDEVDAEESIVRVAQCTAWTERVCREEQPVGGFTWHQAHRHFHFAEFAAYEFRRLGEDDRPDYSPAGLIAVSDKVSFCLMDTEPADPSAQPVPVYMACSPAVQGVSPGWTDVYTSDLPGQNFSLDGLADGRYALIISMDYGNRVYESDDTDNIVEATIEISGDRTIAAVVGRHYP